MLRATRLAAAPIGEPGTVGQEMSATLQATGLAAGHGARVLFSGLDLVLAPGDVVGLVGRERRGQVDAAAPPRRGDRARGGHASAVSPPTATVGHLPQEPERRPGETVGGVPRPPHRGRRRRRRRWTPPPRRWASGAPGADDAYATALDRWLALGGADLDERAEAVADDVGLGVALDTPMTALSGGQAARAGLAALLLSRYDVLLLDEPTNDLDLDGLERLERFVAGLRSPAVVVSHDREFLARTVNRIVELDLAQQTGRRLRRRLRQLPRRARDRPPARARGLRGVRRPARRPQGSRSDAAQLDGPGRPQRPAQVDGQRQDRPQQARRDQREAGGEGPADAAADRAARRRRGAPQGVGAADDDRRGAAVGHGRGVAVGGGRAARGVHARAGRRPRRLGGPGRDHRGQRVGQVDAAGRAARPDPAGRGQRWARVRRSGSARSTRRAGCSSAPSRWCGRSATRCPTGLARTGRRPTCARCWRSSG